MFITHIVGLFTRPEAEWTSIAESRHTLVGVLVQIMVLALIPALAWFYGVTSVGWSLPGGETVYRMTTDSTAIIVGLFYWAMVVGTGALGYGVYWMSRTYGAEPTLPDAMALAAYTNTPLFLAGAVGVVPALWIDLLIGTAAACWAVYLLYLGIPKMMGVPRERGYLFASAALAVALVMFIGLMGATVILWEMGAMPVFTD